MEIDFTDTWTYPVRLPIPSMQFLRPVFRCKADNCNICIKIVIMFFCIEVPEIELKLTRCQERMLPDDCIPYDVYYFASEDKCRL